MSRTIQRVSQNNALVYLEFESQYDFQGKRVVRNWGRYPGAPATCQLGDGVSTGIPTQRVGGHGLVFAGAQWVDTGLTDVFERTQPFSLFVACQVNPSGTNVLIASDDSTQSYRGVSIVTVAGTIYLSVTGGSPGGQAQVRAAISGNTFSTFAMTYDGSSSAAGISLYRDARPVTLTVASDNLTGGTLKSGKPFLVGARHNGSAKSVFSNATVYNSAIFPGILTPQQVAYLDQQCRRRINRA